jgi:hypothetical protein
MRESFMKLMMAVEAGRPFAMEGESMRGMGCGC